MESLHLDITNKILSHVHPDSVLSCKLVCKTWQALLSRFKVGLLIAISRLEEKKDNNSVQLYYADYDQLNKDNDQFSYSALPKINHPPIDMVEDHSPCMVGSCNGLVCISIPGPDSHCHNDPTYICNPMTGEYVNLRALDPKLGRQCQIGSGFGYLSKTNEYKVVRIHYPLDFTKPNWFTHGCVQVYTLGGSGGGEWRNVGNITHLFSFPGVAGNGVIYFIEDFENRLVIFDMADEVFRVPPIQPPCLVPRDLKCSYSVNVLGGYLYVIHENTCESVDLWSYKKNDDNGSETPWKWRKEFSIPWQGLSDTDIYEPFSLTRNNQVLF
ncbi:F-box protein At3g07870-like [Papaver somniferum]|uniref:F-box protein At3g07870-like n=1 Tax=Papaver somniferum TaxID=3469 RepID=UPI000E6FABEF|nr:F-box protein At3g07870-like [Papaver somniferum]